MSENTSRERELGSLATLDAVELVARVERIAKETHDDRLAATFMRLRRGEASVAHLNTCLMDNFRCHRNLEAYSLMYELNHREFLLVIGKRLRFLHAALEPTDILQDVFFSIFRYPHKFRDEKEFSFRNWSYSIIRNTILKHLRGAPLQSHSASESFAETLEDERELEPLSSLEEAENRDECGFRWVLLLGNYLKAFETLSEREKRALTLVEVDGVRYREASEVVGIKLENLKMVICRARKKIFRQIEAVGGGEP